MSILPVLIALSIVLLVIAVAALFWAVDHDQFDDLDTPRLLPLADRATPARTSDQNEPPP
jgi:cbb3-type cytochrome oxidase maturation protein